MVRTRADGGFRAAGSKASCKTASSAGGGGGGGGSTPSGKAGKYAGANGYCSRDTPNWQKGIGSFFAQGCNAENKENDSTPPKRKKAEETEHESSIPACSAEEEDPQPGPSSAPDPLACSASEEEPQPGHSSAPDPEPRPVSSPAVNPGASTSKADLSEAGEHSEKETDKPRRKRVNCIEDSSDED